MKRKKGGEGGASWMDTYGDMVTLLLCFFVLLYSMSTLDQQKWQQVVQSFNPDAIEEMMQASGNNGPNANTDKPGGSPAAQATTQEQVDAMLEQLYEQLTSYTQAQGTEENISVTKGDGYVFLSFNEAVFFDGDSYILRQDGQEVLNEVSAMLDKAAGGIDEIKVLGHTAQSNPQMPNNPSLDRFLASNRATVVLVYLQEHSSLDPARLISVGYGQWRPVASNDSPEGLAKNRRVELIVTGLDVENAMGNSIAHYYTQRDGGPAKEDASAPEDAPTSTASEADSSAKPS